ncbi:MAG: 30S ribosomal protein S18 [Candidatus Aminicenantia bacterium]
MKEEKKERTSFKRFFLTKKKFCRFCRENIRYIDYKDVELLKRFVPDRGKLLPRRVTGTCAFHQRRLAVAVKRARILAFLPFVAE